MSPYQEYKMWTQSTLHKTCNNRSYLSNSAEYNIETRIVFVERKQTFVCGLYNYRKGVCVCLGWTVTQHLVDDHNPNSKMKSYVFWCKIEMHVIFHFTVFCCGFWMYAQQDCEKKGPLLFDTQQAGSL